MAQSSAALPLTPLEQWVLYALVVNKWDAFVDVLAKNAIEHYNFMERLSNLGGSTRLNETIDDWNQRIRASLEGLLSMHAMLKSKLKALQAAHAAHQKAVQKGNSASRLAAPGSTSAQLNAALQAVQDAKDKVDSLNEVCLALSTIIGFWYDTHPLEPRPQLDSSPANAS